LVNPLGDDAGAVCCERHANKEVRVTDSGGTYEQRSDRFTAIEDQFAGYQVYDQSGSKIGKVDDLFVDESDQSWSWLPCWPTSWPT
jgi:Lhr-like helicase